MEKEIKEKEHNSPSAIVNRSENDGPPAEKRRRIDRPSHSAENPTLLNDSVLNEMGPHGRNPQPRFGIVNPFIKLLR